MLMKKVVRVAVEECVTKLKWEVMGENMKKVKEDPAMTAINEVIDQEQREEIEEHERQVEGEATSVFLVRDGVKEWQYSKKRVTSMKGNSRVVLPKIMKNFRDEAALETLRTEVMQVFKTHIKKNCNDRGEQRSNLSNSELRGLRSLKKRVKNGEIVVVPTDKTGKLCVMAREAYEEAGKVHVDKDEKVGQDEVDSIDGEINGNVSLLIKFFRLGKGWNQTGRVRDHR